MKMSTYERPLSSQILSLKDELRRRDNADSMELVKFRKTVEEKEAQIQNLQGVREALEEANMRVGASCIRFILPS